RVSQLRISRMRHPAASDNLHPQCALGSNGDLVLRGLSINEKTAADGILVGHSGAQAVAFLTYKKQHSYGCAFLAQPFAGGNLRRDNAFGVAGASPINVVTVLRIRDVWRNCVHVGGEYELRTAIIDSGLDIKAPVRHRHFVHGIAEAVKLVV